MRHRLQNIIRFLKQGKADALLVWNSEGSGQPATRWLSGFTGSLSILLITRTKRFLITDRRYTAQSKKQAKGYNIRVTSGQMSSLQIVGRLIKTQKIQKILFDGSVTPYSVVEDLKMELPEVIFLSRKRVLQELRLVKEKRELTLLAKVANIACRSFIRLIPLIHIGMTEKELAQCLEVLCVEEGAEGLAFPTIVASGKNGAFPHAVATEKKIQEGELVTIDFGVHYKGYVSDMTRTVAVGNVASRLLKMYEAVREAQELGCRKAKAGVTGQEMDAACREHLTKKGYGKYFTHSTGHGIGMEVHELPIVAPHQAGKERLPVGSVITCEPGVYIPNVGGVRIEDALVLTRKGNVNLTNGMSKEFVSI